MNFLEQTKKILDNDGMITIPYLQRKFQISNEQAREIYSYFFQEEKKPKRKYYFETDEWREKRKKRERRV